MSLRAAVDACHTVLLGELDLLRRLHQAGRVNDSTAIAVIAKADQTEAAIEEMRDRLTKPLAD